MIVHIVGPMSNLKKVDHRPDVYKTRWMKLKPIHEVMDLIVFIRFSGGEPTAYKRFLPIDRSLCPR